MALATTIEPFNESLEDFETYVTRVKMFFVVNDVVEEKKVPLFLTLIGAKYFTLTKNLLSPKSPETCKLEAIIAALNTHFKPKTIEIYERYKFYSRNQKPSESIQEYVAELKALAHSCNFEKQLETALRDKLVMGVSNKNIQQSFFTEAELTFDKAYKLAIAKEAAMRDVLNIKSLGICNNNKSEEAEVNKINFKPKRLQGKPFEKYIGKKFPKPNIPKNSCNACGGNHWKKDCSFAKAECFKCKKIGHIAKMCFTKTHMIKSSPIKPKSNGATESDHSEYDFLFNITSGRVPPIMMDLLVNKTKVSMEVDTGSFHTVMSLRTFEDTWPVKARRPTITDSNNELKVYGGSNLKVVGTINTSISYENKTTTGDIIIVQDDGPTLLGRGLMSRLELSNISLNLVNSLHTSWESEFPELFSPELGCLKGREFSIEVDETVKPKFCKARPVPYMMRDKVCKELDRLESEGIISPVAHAESAAPLVPVLKPNGGLRLCGDYKLTINKVSKMDTYPIPKLQDLFSQLNGGVKFSKLDMSQAYNQLVLDEKSKKADFGPVP